MADHLKIDTARAAGPLDIVVGDRSRPLDRDGEHKPLIQRHCCAVNGCREGNPFLAIGRLVKTEKRECQGEQERRVSLTWPASVRLGTPCTRIRPLWTLEREAMCH